MIANRSIKLGLLSVLLSGLGLWLCMVLQSWPWLLLCAAGLLAYWQIDKHFLRCPHCGGFINLNNLMLARRRKYHCMHCGNRIEIQ